ncbi:protein LOW PSII ACCUMULATION 3, chloroplastic-like [Neltuma alba]|uniref:protein LOW PSII ACCUMULATION 3, chloroplastic-like n=1 Tax=Neltuma alba TaxID=207710 RepID=UPI0010A3AEDB|nr:protein LOW PSII ACCUMULATION 3, chloroplastic-like [Prosopis alba]
MALLSSMAFASPSKFTLLRSFHSHPPLLSSSSSSISFTFLRSAFSVPQRFHKFPLNTAIRCAERDVASTKPGFDPKAGVAVYKPKSYEVLVTDAANSLAYALEDGKSRLEIDFP